MAHKTAELVSAFKASGLGPSVSPWEGAQTQGGHQSECCAYGRRLFRAFACG